VQHNFFALDFTRKKKKKKKERAPTGSTRDNMKRKEVVPASVLEQADLVAFLLHNGGLPLRSGTKLT
jgi:hypothetical protein